MKIIILKIELVFFFFLDKYNFKSFFLFFLRKKNALNFIKKLENQLSNLIGNYALGMTLIVTPVLKSWTRLELTNDIHD